MRRTTFLASVLGALSAFRAPARATGGLDVEEGAPAAHVVRVLLASGTGYPPPETIDASSFRWNGTTYRGTCASVTLPDGRPGLLNTLPLDPYLYGVVSKEVSPAWPREAQEAQAIVARTYALGKLRPERAWDVVAGESDQRYGGLAGESVEGRGAVDATAGIVVTADGAPARVAFSSCCGGYTADAGETWGRAFPYLPAHADPYCVNSPAFRWKADVSYETFVRALGEDVGSIGQLDRVELRDLDVSGRPRSLAIVGAQRTLAMRTPDFRAKLGYGVVKSTLVRTVSLARGGLFGWAMGNVTIEGNGNGHGVGMCQWGARQMGASGATSRDIIQFYFPTTSLGRG
jgi:stage II sporulation protein D